MLRSFRQVDVGAFTRCAPSRRRRSFRFAGHPTLGTCHAWLSAGGHAAQADVIVQQCAAGLIPVRRTADGLAFAAPPLVRSGSGTALGRSGRVHVATDVEGAIWVGGGTVTCVAGQVEL